MRLRDVRDFAAKVQYVVQIERQTGEWAFVGGYAGTHVTRQQAIALARDGRRALLRGDLKDFLGQFRLNSHFRLAVRYSF